MSTLAFCRVLACSGAGLKGTRGCSDPNNRRGQDTSRNVRPVGREKIYNQHNDLQYIANCARTFLILLNRLFRSAFRTLRRSR